MALQGKNDGKKKEKTCVPNVAAVITIRCELVCVRTNFHDDLTGNVKQPFSF
jgi:hypothetical protein